LKSLEKEVILSFKTTVRFLYEPVPDMTYNVFGGTFNLTQSIIPVRTLLTIGLLNHKRFARNLCCFNLDVFFHRYGSRCTGHFAGQWTPCLDIWQLL